MREKLAGNDVSPAGLVQREAQGLRAQFQKLYGEEARVFRAPGRVNLIGEHTDYNEGFVMPVAIDFATYVEVSERADRRLVVYSEHYSETSEFALDDPHPLPRGHWSDYVRGVAMMV